MRLHKASVPAVLKVACEQSSTSRIIYVSDFDTTFVLCLISHSEGQIYHNRNPTANGSISVSRESKYWMSLKWYMYFSTF